MRLLFVIGLLFFSLFIRAQIQHPKASPYTEIHQDIGLTRIKLTYSRPAVRGRNLLGEVVPYGRIWRVGANESTKFITNRDISVMGNSLPAGSYALYAFPYPEYWEIVFHTNTSHWGDGRDSYKAEEDLFRIKVFPTDTASWQENFEIGFDSIQHNQALMTWHWGHTRLKIPLKTNTDLLMQLEIEKELMKNPTALSYYEAARYYQEQQIQNKLALKYVNKAIELGGDTYYFYRVKSLIQATDNNYKGAIESAEKSMDLAAEENKDEFVAMNKRNIATWKSLIKDRQK